MPRSRYLPLAEQLGALRRSSLRPVWIGSVVILGLFASSASSAWAAKRKGPSSKLYVADLSGVAEIDTGERIEPLTKQSVFDASGTILQTRPGATNSIVFSNGSGLFLEGDSRVFIEQFVQEPFLPNRNDLDVEPSISRLTATLSYGRLGLCTSRLVAGSAMTFRTPHGSIAIRGRRVSLEVTETTTIVSLLEGDVTVRGGALDSGGQTLRPGQRAVIRATPQADVNAVTVEDIPADTTQSVDDRVTQACIARRTVYFDTGESAFDPEQDELTPVPLVPTLPPNPTFVSPSEIPDSDTAPESGS